MSYSNNNDDSECEKDKRLLKIDKGAKLDNELSEISIE